MLRRFDLPPGGMSRRPFSKASIEVQSGKKKLGVDGDIDVCSILQNACPPKASDPSILPDGKNSSTFGSSQHSKFMQCCHDSNFFWCLVVCSTYKSRSFLLRFLRGRCLAEACSVVRNLVAMLSATDCRPHPHRHKSLKAFARPVPILPIKSIATPIFGHHSRCHPFLNADSFLLHPNQTIGTVLIRKEGPIIRVMMMY